MPRRNAVSPPPWNDHLVLFRFFLNLFGKDTLAELVGMMNNSEYEGMDENQNTFFWRELDNILSRQGENAKISRDTLREYDERICRYVKQIGENRGGIRLKYFQYIACLFTEIYLEWYFRDKSAFAAELNRFAGDIFENIRNNTKPEPFTPTNMNKLAYMCATGSGKTLIMHINILQFKYYLKKAQQINSRFDINRIIVLAPNEGMSNQHLSELNLSNISAEPFAKAGFAFSSDVVVIDMNKLKEEGKVKTVSIDSFEQNNLVLVDEAHRGLAGDVWYDYRSRLSAEGGFAFEYSATLKQAMKSGKPSNTSQKEWKERLDDYFRSIIIDYSYKYFYEDGYGKEYRIHNLIESVDDEQRQLYLTGCLLSFYQQLKLFAERYKEFTPFMVEKPLLVFVGNRVTAKTTTAEMTDVEEVLVFINNFVKNKKRAISRIRTIINEDETGLTDGHGRELFSQNFYALRDVFGGGLEPNAIYRDVLRIVFNCKTVSEEPRLHMLDLRQLQGEIALRIGSDGEQFGVISIGSSAKLVKNCEEKGIVTGADEFTNTSLFQSINEKDSKINILIGSRKFSEGWNSWRVSTMGLINFARGEGSQAIQLFGRGVRLRGHGGSLKRSRKLDNRYVSIPKYLELVETLTIFGIRAQYMEDFKKYLEREDLPTNGRIHEFTLNVKNRYDETKHSSLRVIGIKDGVNFKKQSARLILGAPDEGFLRYLNKHKVIIDCRSKVQTLESTSNIQGESVVQECRLDKSVLPFFDHERILDELEIYKNEKFYYNISLCKDNFIEIISTPGWYSLIIPQSHTKVDSLEKLELNTDFAIMILKSYIDKFYRYEKSRWETPLLEYQQLKADNANFVDEYNFTYADMNEDDSGAEQLERFIDEINVPFEDERNEALVEDRGLGRILVAFDFNAHLYTPLIVLSPESFGLSVSPVSLNMDEKVFIDRLKWYVGNKPTILENSDLYILRNKSKVGMGFFEADNFYPDFVLWIDTPDTQYISFVDPKSLRMYGWNDPKIEFYAKIKELQERLEPTAGDKCIVLNSFIMSGTPSADLYHLWGKSSYERHEKNIFCLDDPDCIAKMMEKIFYTT